MFDFPAVWYLYKYWYLKDEVKTGSRLYLKNHCVCWKKKIDSGFYWSKGIRIANKQTLNH